MKRPSERQVLDAFEVLADYYSFHMGMSATGKQVEEVLEDAFARMVRDTSTDDKSWWIV